MIAHRLNTLKRCDLIYDIQNGEINNALTYEKLVEVSYHINTM